VTDTAASEEQETPMPYLAPPRTPLTPEQVHRAFAHLMALEAWHRASLVPGSHAATDARSPRPPAHSGSVTRWS
jgi:hypothetical protein